MYRWLKIRTWILGHGYMSAYEVVPVDDGLTTMCVDFSWYDVRESTLKVNFL